MWRYIDISGDSYHLCINNKNICIKKNGLPDVFIGIKDVNSIVVHGRQNTFTEEFLCSCMENNIPLSFCDSKHLPLGMLLSYNQHEKSPERLFLQINTSVPRKKQAWKHIVEAKIAAQAKLLKILMIPENKVLYEKSKRVKSGDNSNEEAQAARLYFEKLFGDNFVRYDDEDEINKLLNYGYSIIRSMVARAVCAHGLHPSISIYHSNRVNSFALVDDLMEPLRPFVDFNVAKAIINNEVVLNVSNKKRMIALITQRCCFNHKEYELKDAVDLYILEYLHFIEGSTEEIKVPEFSPEEEIFCQ